MSDFDWDELQIINNPDLKEITVSFNGDGGLGAFGSNNSSGSGGDPGALPTIPPDDPESPDRPVLPSPEDNAGGTLDPAPPAPILPGPSDLLECGPHDCDALQDYYNSGAGSPEMALGINPTYRGGFQTAQAFSSSPQPIDHAGGQPSSILTITFDPYDAPYPGDNVNGLCEVAVRTWTFGGGMASFGANGLFINMGVPLANDPPSALDPGLSMLEVYTLPEHVVSFFLDTSMTQSFVMGNVILRHSTASLTTVSAGNVLSQGGTTPTTVPVQHSMVFRVGDDISVPAGGGFILTPFADFDPNLELTGSVTTLNSGAAPYTWAQAHGWWTMRAEDVFSFQAAETPQGEPQRYRIIYQRLLSIAGPDGRTVTTLSTAIPANTIEKFLGFNRYGGVSPGPMFVWSQGLIGTNNDQVPRMLAIANDLNQEALILPRTLRAYTPPDYCDRLP